MILITFTGFNRTAKRARIIKKALADDPDVQNDPTGQDWLESPLKSTSKSVKKDGTKKKLTVAQQAQHLKYREVPISDEIEGLAERYLPGNLEGKTEDLALSLYNMLKPIYVLVGGLENLGIVHPYGATSTKFHKRKAGIIRGLFDIIAVAARISIRMRLDSETIYYFPPTAKDDIFSSKNMSCVNERQMLANDPYSAKASKKKGHKSTGEHIDGLVRVIVMDGCTSFRKYGWSTDDDQQSGFRTYDLLPARVVCSWGTQRRFGSEATQKDAGYKELRQVVQDICGVDPVDDLEKKRAGEDEKSKKAGRVVS